MGINKLDPKEPDDVEKVHDMVVPKETIAQTTQVYRYIFWRLTGKTIDQYLRDVLDVRVLKKQKRGIAIICGSESDLPDIKSVCGPRENIRLNVVSCHRNPEELVDLVRDMQGVDVIIGVGGKALALPGVIDAWAHHFKKNIRVAGVALGEEGSNELLAAQLSIEELPSQPVIVDEFTGRAYVGSSGLRKLIQRIDEGELPPAKPRKEKPVRLNIQF